MQALTPAARDVDGEPDGQAQPAAPAQLRGVTSEAKARPRHERTAERPDGIAAAVIPSRRLFDERLHGRGSRLSDGPGLLRGRLASGILLPLQVTVACQRGPPK